MASSKATGVIRSSDDSSSPSRFSASALAGAAYDRSRARNSVLNAARSARIPSRAEDRAAGGAWRAPIASPAPAIATAIENPASARLMRLMILVRLKPDTTVIGAQVYETVTRGGTDYWRAMADWPLRRTYFWI